MQSRYRSTHSGFGMSLLISSGSYILGWIVGVLLILVFVTHKSVEGVVVHPRINVFPWVYISHNLVLEGMLLLGTLTLGVATCIILFGNGLFSGILATLISQHYGLGFLLIGLLPHGIPEVSAWIITGAASLILGRDLTSIVFRKKSQTSDEQRGGSTWHTCIKIVGVAAILLVVAGMLEAYVSPQLLLVMR